MTIQLTEEEFKEKVYNWDESKEWKYQGDKPCIIDFYADWCGPCKTLSPILEKLSEEYKDKLIVYKIDTEAEKQLAGMFQIRSIPSVLFVPVEGQPQMSVGLLPEDGYKKAFAEVLGI